MKKHYRSCNLCEATCGLVIEHDASRIISIKGDKDDPFSQGHVCPKAVALKDVHTDPDRLHRPIRRSKGTWKEISWKEAIDYVSSHLRKIQNEFGKDAVAVYQGNPNVHNLGLMLYGRHFRKALGTRNLFSATSVDQLPHHLVAQHMFGHPLMLPVPDIGRTDFFLVIGANPLVSNGSLMTAPNMSGLLQNIRTRRGKVVVVDPRKTETAMKADDHLFIIPGTDVFFLATFLKELFALKKQEEINLKSQLQGVEKLKQIMDQTEFPWETTGISLDRIKGLASSFLKADRAVCYGRIGVSTQKHGTLCQWLINCINIISGNFDREGGQMFTTPAFPVRFSSKRPSSPRWHSRVRNLPEVIGELPVAALEEEITTPGPGQVKGFVCIAGNPVLSTPKGDRLNRALKQLKFMVSIDPYLNETSRHANIILPPAFGLDSSHYDLIFNTLAIRNTAKYSPPLYAPKKGQRLDWQILKRLTIQLNKGRSSFIDRVKFAWLNPERMLSIALKRGPYHQSMNLTLRKLKEHPHGIDLGPLIPVTPSGLFTEDNKIHLAPKLYIQALETLASSPYQPVASSKYPFLLIGKRILRSNNSWMHNSHRLVKGPQQCTIQVNTNDAIQLEITSGQNVRVESSVGSVVLPAEINDHIMQGIVCMPHGWGHQQEDIRLRVAQQNPGVSINDLTDPQSLDALSGNAVLSGVPVRISKYRNTGRMEQ